MTEQFWGRRGPVAVIETTQSDWSGVRRCNVAAKKKKKKTSECLRESQWPETKRGAALKSFARWRVEAEDARRMRRTDASITARNSH